jgi:outer membrane protein assembly factor BamB
VTEEQVVIAGRDRLVRALDPKSGETIWEWNSGGRLDSSPVIVGERVFLGTQKGELTALDLATGAVGWSFETGAAILASPSVAAGMLVISNLDGVVYAFR